MLPHSSELSSPPQGETAGFRITTPDALGFNLGAWEIFQEPRFLDIYARHYRQEVMQHRGMLLLARKMPVAGTLYAKLFSPEASAGVDWRPLLEDLRVGQLEVLTNRPTTSPTAFTTTAGGLYSMLVDLRVGADTLFSGFEGRARKAVRRAAKAGMQIRLAQDKKDVADFHALLEKVTDQGRRYEVPSLELLEAIRQAGFGHLYLAVYQQRIAGGIYVLSNRYAHGFVSGYDPQACDGLPGNLLYWKTMLGEMGRGIPFFDLGAQNLGDNPNLTLAKRVYAPVLLPAFRYELQPSPCRNKLLMAWRKLKGGETR